jgi:hypothetical protein
VSPQLVGPVDLDYLSLGFARGIADRPMRSARTGVYTLIGNTLTRLSAHPSQRICYERRFPAKSMWLNAQFIMFVWILHHGQTNTNFRFGTQLLCLLPFSLFTVPNLTCCKGKFKVEFKRENSRGAKLVPYQRLGFQFKLLLKARLRSPLHTKKTLFRLKLPSKFLWERKFDEFGGPTKKLLQN